jgi:hypothetical protein
MNNTAQLVRARRKQVAELPTWALCCQATRELLERDRADPPEAPVDPSEILVGRSQCISCGRIVPGLRFMRVLRELRGAWHPIPQGERRVIAVDCFEFDEGPAEDRA